MTRRNLKKIVKITGLLAIIAITTALTSCETNTGQSTKIHHDNTSYSFHSFLTSNDVHTSLSELWKLS